MMEDEKLVTGEEAANLENEALKRKKRIEALRQLKEQQTRQSSIEAQQQSLPRYPSISNYINNIFSNRKVGLAADGNKLNW
jgi:hypothetical protein